MRFAFTSRAFIRATYLATLFLAVAPLRAADDTAAMSVPLVEARQLHYLAPGKPDVAALLAPPPTVDSLEQAADMDAVRAVYRSASGNDVAAANEERKFSVFNFAETAGPFMVETNLPKTAAFFKKVQKDAATVTDDSKNYFRRPRPYTLDTNLANGKLETSFSYPSGHSTESMVLALVLADLIPDQREAIISHACGMGWHRVQIARHYPTDVFAGRVLAKAIVREMKANPDFNRDLEEARRELAAAKSPTSSQSARNQAIGP